MKKEKNTTLRLTELAIMSAVIILMALTPIGYLKVGPLSITFLPIPVAIGAIVQGKKGGAVLGLIFGLTSFYQCFGMDPFGVQLFAISPIYAAVMCIIPRVLAGFIAGAVFEGMKKVSCSSLIKYALAGFLSAAMNTILFVTALIALFGNSEPVKALGENVKAIIGVLITTNSLIEAIATTILVAIIAKACIEAIQRRRR